MSPGSCVCSRLTQGRPQGQQHGTQDCGHQNRQAKERGVIDSGALHELQDSENAKVHANDREPAPAQSLSQLMPLEEDTHGQCRCQVGDADQNQRADVSRPKCQTNKLQKQQNHGNGNPGRHAATPQPLHFVGPLYTFRCSRIQYRGAKPGVAFRLPGHSVLCAVTVVVPAVQAEPALNRIRPWNMQRTQLAFNHVLRRTRLRACAFSFLPGQAIGPPNANPDQHNNQYEQVFHVARPRTTSSTKREPT